MSSRYVISKCASGWVIAVGGSMQLICESEAVALQTVRDAEASECDAAARRGADRGVDALVAAHNARKRLASTAA